MADKELASIWARMHPLVDHWYFTDLPTPRAATGAVLQTQWLEFISPQFTFEVTFKLVAVLLRAGAHKRTIKIGVGVHGGGL
jgi:folylpolyglutamate synthase/dihydropteroate synthase